MGTVSGAGDVQKMSFSPFLSIDMKTKVFQHVTRIKLDNLITRQLDNMKT